MANYSVEISQSAERALKKLSKSDLAKIIEAIGELANDPYPKGCRKLAGDEGTFRVRVGTFRIIYDVIKKRLLIQVLKVGRRKDVYR